NGHQDVVLADNRLGFTAEALASRTAAGTAIALAETPAPPASAAVELVVVTRLALVLAALVALAVLVVVLAVAIALVVLAVLVVLTTVVLTAVVLTTVVLPVAVALRMLGLGALAALV